MMKYQQSKNKQKATAAVLLLITTIVVVSFGRGRELFEQATSPLLGINANANSAIETLLDETKSRRELQNELETLREENRLLTLENLNQQILREYNKELKKQLGWIDSAQLFSVSRIISRPPVTPFDSLTVQISGKDGVAKGQRVRLAETVEVGKVSVVNKTTAIIKLYSTAGTKTPVEINGGGPLVVAEGSGAGSYILRVPRSYDIKIGDYLTRPGTEAVIIGVVESVKMNEADSFLLVKARLPANLFEATWVYIETEGQSSL